MLASTEMTSCDSPPSSTRVGPNSKSFAMEYLLTISGQDKSNEDNRTTKSLKHISGGSPLLPFEDSSHMASSHVLDLSRQLSQLSQNFAIPHLYNSCLLTGGLPPFYGRPPLAAHYPYSVPPSVPFPNGFPNPLQPTLTPPFLSMKDFSSVAGSRLFGGGAPTVANPDNNRSTILRSTLTNEPPTELSPFSGGSNLDESTHTSDLDFKESNKTSKNNKLMYRHNNIIVFACCW